jgi:hypothetical protein
VISIIFDQEHLFRVATFRPGAMGLHAYLLRSFSRVASSLWDAQIAFWTLVMLKSEDCDDLAMERHNLRQQTLQRKA